MLQALADCRTAQSTSVSDSLQLGPDPESIDELGSKVGRVRPAAPSPFGPAHTQKPGTSEYLSGDRAYCIAHGERARSTSAKTGTVVGSAEQARRTMLQIGVTLGSRGAMMARHFRGGKELEDYLTPPKRG